MISVVIPALNAERHLGACLEALVPAAISGHVREVIVSDGGSTDNTTDIAEEAGARLVQGATGRGAQLSRGAAAARGGWLLFLHADTVLDQSWAGEVERFMGEGASRAGVFTLKFDRDGLAPSLIAKAAMARTALFRSPYGDQGLLISRQLFDEAGGYREMPLFEDVDIIDRIIKTKGRGALHVFNARAITSAARYERDGYFNRVLKNTICLAMFRAGVKPSKILRFYQK